MHLLSLIEKETFILHESESELDFPSAYLSQELLDTVRKSSETATQLSRVYNVVVESVFSVGDFSNRLQKDGQRWKVDLGIKILKINHSPYIRGMIIQNGKWQNGKKWYVQNQGGF